MLAAWGENRQSSQVKATDRRNSIFVNLIGKKDMLKLGLTLGMGKEALTGRGEKKK